MDSTTPDVCDKHRIHSHKVFKGLAGRGKGSTDWFYGRVKYNRPLAKSRKEFKITDSGNQVEAQPKAFPTVTVTLGYYFETLDKADGVFIRYSTA